MLNWLRRRNAPARVAVIESLPVDGKRSVILVRRDNIEHLVMVGGRNDLVIEQAGELASLKKRARRYAARPAAAAFQASFRRHPECGIPRLSCGLHLSLDDHRESECER
jgi:hypothetical protein